MTAQHNSVKLSILAQVCFQVLPVCAMCMLVTECVRTLRRFQLLTTAAISLPTALLTSGHTGSRGLMTRGHIVNFLQLDHLYLHHRLDMIPVDLTVLYVKCESNSSCVVQRCVHPVPCIPADASNTATILVEFSKPMIISSIFIYASMSYGQAVSLTTRLTVRVLSESGTIVDEQTVNWSLNTCHLHQVEVNISTSTFTPSKG